MLLIWQSRVIKAAWCKMASMVLSKVNTVMVCSGSKIWITVKMYNASSSKSIDHKDSFKSMYFGPNFLCFRFWSGCALIRINLFFSLLLICCCKFATGHECNPTQNLNLVLSASCTHYLQTFSRVYTPLKCNTDENVTRHDVHRRVGNEMNSFLECRTT